MKVLEVILKEYILSHLYIYWGKWGKYLKALIDKPLKSPSGIYLLVGIVGI